MKYALPIIASLLLFACSDDGPDMVGAPGVTIEEVAVYQGVKHSIVGGDAGVSVPLVAGRDALVRVFATGGAEYNRGPVTARLTLATREGEPEVFEETIGNLPVQVDEPFLNSTINFWIPGESITTDTNYRLELLQDSSIAEFDNEAAAYPTAKNMVIPLGAKPATRPLEIVLVPVTNNGREPDISQAQLDRYRDGFMDQYPATSVEISVREAITFDDPLTSGGQGWSQLLNGIADLRSRDQVGPEVYYYGIFEPASTFSQYCNGGCILGLGFVPRETDTFMRVAIGLGYSGDGSVETAVHEIGHTHGRQHAPCGVDGADPAFPNAGGTIGTWGLSMSARELKAPYDFTDFMGYCRDTWVSDYTYKALYERMRFVDGQRLDGSARTTYGRVAIGPDGESEVLTPVAMGTSLKMQRSFTATDEAGNSIDGEGHFVPYDHIEGGILLVPERFSGLDITDLSQFKLDR